MSLTTCDSDKKNLGVSACNRLPQMFAGMFTTPLDFEIPDDTVDVEQFLQDALLNPDPKQRIYQWPSFVGLEDAKEDTVYEETPLADLRVRAGKYRWRVQIVTDLCIHRAMFTHLGGNQRILFYDVENQVFGTKTSTGIKGFTVSLLSPEKLIISDGSAATKSPVYIVLKNTKEIDKNGVLFDADFINDLTRLSDVDIAIVGTPTATAIKFTVKGNCDNVDVLGLVAADIVLLKTDGTVQTVTSLTNAGGVYTAHGTGLLTGTIDIVAPDELSIPGYESTGPATVTIS
jgi:hypothetical protein